MQQEAVGIAGAEAPDRRAAERLFHRDLPGGGYVTIELAASRNPAGGQRQARVIVERRGDPSRRAGHRPPVIHEETWKPERGLDELYRIATDNVAIARALLRLRRAD